MRYSGLSARTKRDERQDTADAFAGYVSTAEIACEVNGAQGRQQQEPTEETLKRSAIAPERSVGILALQGGEDVKFHSLLVPLGV